MISKILFVMGSFEFLVGLESKIRKCILFSGSLKFMFSKKATKIDEIFIVNLTLCSKCQIGGDFVNLCGLLGKHELFLGCLQF